MIKLFLRSYAYLKACNLVIIPCSRLHIIRTCIHRRIQDLQGHFLGH